MLGQKDFKRNGVAGGFPGWLWILPGGESQRCRFQGPGQGLQHFGRRAFELK